jgi:hypothetical protein
MITVLPYDQPIRLNPVVTTQIDENGESYAVSSDFTAMRRGVQWVCYNHELTPAEVMLVNSVPGLRFDNEDTFRQWLQ